MVLKEFGSQYHERVGVTVSRRTLLFIPYNAMLKQLGFLVDWLLIDKSADFAQNEYSRREATENIAPMWDEFFGNSPPALAHVDAVFRVAALALHAADQSTSRIESNVWFDAASTQLRRIEELTSGSHQ